MEARGKMLESTSYDDVRPHFLDVWSRSFGWRFHSLHKSKERLISGGGLFFLHFEAFGMLFIRWFEVYLPGGL